MLDATVVDIRDVDNSEKPLLHNSGNFGPGHVMVKGLIARQDIFKPPVEKLALELIENKVGFDNIAGNATGGMIPAYQCREDYQHLSGREIGFSSIISDADMLVVGSLKRQAILFRYHLVVKSRRCAAKECIPAARVTKDKGGGRGEITLGSSSGYASCRDIPAEGNCRKAK